MFAPLIAIALATWGVVATLPIFAVADTHIDSAAANRYTDRCEIAYNPAWFASLNPEQQQSVIDHETLHCLGVTQHLPPNQVGVMSGLSSGQPFSGYDRLLFWHEIRPAPYRLFVAY